MTRWIIALAFFALASTAQAQTGVYQSGNITSGHNACWLTTGVINDCGVPANTPYLLTNAPVTLTDAATVTPDLNLGNVFTWTLTTTGRTLANPLNISSASLGQRFVIYLIQGGSGSATITTWGSVYKFSGGTKPTLTTALNSIDRVTCEIETTTVFTCAAILNFE